MKFKFPLKIWPWLTLTAFWSVADGFTLKKPCGDNFCAPREYCYDPDYTCKACSDVCERESHNFNEDMCDKQCQDYTYDRSNLITKEELEYYRSVIHQMHFMITITLILTLLVTSVISAVSFAYLYKYRREVVRRRLEEKKFEEKLNGVQYSTKDKKCDVIRTISRSMQNNDPSTTTTQTDTEDTLDYAAYVNHVMSEEKNQRENSPKF